MAGIEAGEFDLPLDELISSGAKHHFILETCASCVGSSDSSHKLSVSKCMDHIAGWIERWEAAAAEAETLGLGRHISYKDWQQNIELPEVFIKVKKWFDTAEKVANSNVMDPPRLRKLIKDANHRVASLECRAHPTRVGRQLDKWKFLVRQWASKIKYMELEKKRNDLIMKKIKKRRCSICGISAPYSSRALDYCGGCRHPSVAREDRPRYCSVECQRAHWLAGHKDECPCAARDL